MDPGHLTRKTFRFWFGLTILAGGFLFANFTVDERQKNDAWYCRPDLKPFPAMVPKEDMDITERTMLETHYQSYRNKAYSEDKKHRTWYRLFFPLSADYTVKRNPYHSTHRDNVYNPNNGYFATIGNNHFRDHTNE